MSKKSHHKRNPKSRRKHDVPTQPSVAQRTTVRTEHKQTPTPRQERKKSSGYTPSIRAKVLLYATVWVMVFGLVLAMVLPAMGA